jgi:hypothetical protein
MEQLRVVDVGTIHPPDVLCAGKVNLGQPPPRTLSSRAITALGGCQLRPFPRQ